MARLAKFWATPLLYGFYACGTATAQSPVVTSSSSAKSASVTAAASIGTATVNGTPTTYSVQFTVPAAADEGMNILPNIDDPEAVDAQSVCPGYIASDVKRTAFGFAATLALAGQPVSAPLSV